MTTHQTRQSFADIRRALKAAARPDKRDFFPKFFKNGKGEYAEGDQFYGVIVPDIRAIARASEGVSEATVVKLLSSKIHEERLTALVILTRWKAGRKDPARSKRALALYLKHMKQVNHWDLVDLSCGIMIGPEIETSMRPKLYEWARSKNLWFRRIAIISTLPLIRLGKIDDTMKLARILLKDPHDLMHKAVGWMLREVGKRDLFILEEFLREHAAVMPRTMLRYAIEKLPETSRQRYLKARKEI